MVPTIHNSFFITCAQLPDLRLDRTHDHTLLDIFFCSLRAVLCGAEEGTAIADFSRARTEWLQQYIEMANGMPSHDTSTHALGRIVLGRIDPDWQDGHSYGQRLRQCQWPQEECDPEGQFEAKTPEGRLGDTVSQRITRNLRCDSPGGKSSKVRRILRGGFLKILSQECFATVRLLCLTRLIFLGGGRSFRLAVLLTPS